MKRGLESMHLIKQWRSGIPQEKGPMKRSSSSVELLKQWRGSQELHDCLSAELTEREQQVLELRYGTKEKPTFASIADLLKISPGRCQKIEESGLRKLCHPSIEFYFQERI